VGFRFSVTLSERTFTSIMTSFIVYLQQKVKNVGLGKVRLKLKHEDKTIALKVNECTKSLLMSMLDNMQKLPL